MRELIGSLGTEQGWLVDSLVISCCLFQFLDSL